MVEVAHVSQLEEDSRQSTSGLASGPVVGVSAIAQTSSQQPTTQSEKGKLVALDSAQQILEGVAMNRFEDEEHASGRPTTNDTSHTPKNVSTATSSDPVTPVNKATQNANQMMAGPSHAEKLTPEQRQQLRFERQQARIQQMPQPQTIGNHAAQQQHARDTAEARNEESQPQGEASVALPSNDLENDKQPVAGHECVATQPATSMQDST